MKTAPVIFMAALAFATACEIRPRNTLHDCREQCKDSENPKACCGFCDCIHTQGQPLDKCLDQYDQDTLDNVPYDRLPYSFIRSVMTRRELKVEPYADAAPPVAWPPERTARLMNGATRTLPLPVWKSASM